MLSRKNKLALGLTLIVMLAGCSANEAPAESTVQLEEAEIQSEESVPVSEAVAEEVAPVAEEEAPVAEDVAPVAEDVAPVSEDVAPVAEDVAPVAEEEAPVAEDVAPVAEEEAPVSGAVAPVSEAVAPVAEEVAPVAEDVAPVAEAVGPVSEEVAPLAEEATPAAEKPTGLTGTFTAKGSQYDDYGWKPSLSLIFENGKIISVDYDEVNADGNKKSKDTGYLSYYNQQTGVKLEEVYDKMMNDLLKQQSPESIDAVSGATVARDNFVDLAKKIIKDNQ